MSQAAVALLRDAYRDFNSADFPAASQALAPDIEWVESGTGMPYSGTWHGTASVVNDVWTSFVQYWGGPGVVGMETDQFLDAGNHIVVTGRFTGKDSAGHTLDAPCAHVWRMEGGLAVRFQNYTDWTVANVAFWTGRAGRRTPRTASANGIDTDSRVTPGPPGPEGDVGDSPIRVVLEPDGKAAFHPPDMGARRVEGVAGTVLSSKSASDDDVVARVEELIRLHANHPGTAPVLHEGRPDVVHHAGGTVPGAAVGHPRARLHPLDVGSESLARRREICAVEVPVGVAQQSHVGLRHHWPPRTRRGDRPPGGGQVSRVAASSSAHLGPDAPLSGLSHRVERRVQ